MSAAEISMKPPNTTLSPYTLVVDKTALEEVTKRSTASVSDSQYWRYDVPHKRHKSGSGEGNKLCFKFIYSGSCPRGEKCNFQHDMDAREQYLGGVCLDFLIKGKCERGPDCNFKHNLLNEGESHSRRRRGSENDNGTRLVFFFFTINCSLLNDVLFWFKLFEPSSFEALNVDFLVLFCYFS